jgi:hypothetical protein
MPRVKPLRLLIGLRLRDPASEACSRAAETLLEEATSLLPHLPLAWNLPLAPLEAGRGRADLAVEIKTRVRSRSDSVLLMGYGGGPHPLLAAEELERELDWCRRNPWGSGAKSLLGQEPKHLLPLAADLAREALDGVYGRHGFETVGLAEPLEQALARFSPHGGAGWGGAERSPLLRRAADPATAAWSGARYRGAKRNPLLRRQAAYRPSWTAYRFAVQRPPRGAVLYRVLVLGAGGATLPTGWPEAAAGLAGSQPLFLLLDLGGETRAEDRRENRPEGWPQPTLAPLLRALEARYQPEFLSLEEALALAEAPPAGGGTLGAPDPLPLLCPAALEAASRAESLRAKTRRRTDADLRAVLETLGDLRPRPRPAPRPREARRAAEPTLIAAMSGLVALQGDGLAATFADGRLSGLQKAQTSALGAGPADSYLIAGGRFLPLESESAFSFEQGQDSGLRSVLKAPLDGGEAELIIQACFREGQKDLELDFRLRFPELSPQLDLQAVVPLEMPVFALAAGEQAAVSGELPGGGSLAATLEAEEGERLFTGARLRLAKAGGGPALVFSPRAPSGVVILGVRVIRLRRGLHVLASPFGARFAAPSRLYSGRTVSFALRLDLEE